jgi:hypothetical protein
MRVTRKPKKHDQESKLPEIEKPDTPQRRRIGLDAGKGWVSEDFNDPLPDELWGF